MQKIIKIIAVSLVVLLVTGCAASRKAKERRAAKEEISSGNLSTVISGIRSYNITGDGFIIKKGRIDLIGGTPV
ncbi:MAG: hypothetical protein WAL94_11705, partial [Bacteroidales bacterium]